MRARLPESGVSSGSFRESHFTCSNTERSADDSQLDVFILKILDSECLAREHITFWYVYGSR